MTVEEVEKKVKSYFDDHDGEVLYPSEVAEAIKVDYGDVLLAIESLRRRNEIEFAG